MVGRAFVMLTYNLSSQTKEVYRSTRSRSASFEYLALKKFFLRLTIQEENLLKLLTAESDQKVRIYLTISSKKKKDFRDDPLKKYIAKVLHEKWNQLKNPKLQITIQRTTILRRVILPQRKRGYDDKGSLRKGLPLELLPPGETHQKPQIVESLLSCLSGVGPTEDSSPPDES